MSVFEFRESIDALLGLPVKPKNDPATEKHPDIIILDDPVLSDQATREVSSFNDKVEEHESK